MKGISRVILGFALTIIILGCAVSSNIPAMISQQGNLHPQPYTNTPFIPYSGSYIHAHSQCPDRKR